MFQQHQTKQYTDKLVKLAGFSFPFNNLLMVSLTKRIPADSQDQKETHFGFVTCVMGVGNNNDRTYDFNQKIVQKFSLKDLGSLSFTLKELARNNLQVLPFTKFTNSGSGSKTLYIQYKEQLDNFNNINNYNNQNQFQNGQTQNVRRVQNNIVVGCSHNNLKINIPLSKFDAYSIADIIEKLYNVGIKLEIEDQINKNKNQNDLSPFANSEFNTFPANGINTGIPFPSNNPVNGGQIVSSNNTVFQGMPNSNPGYLNNNVNNNFNGNLMNN